MATPQRFFSPLWFFSLPLRSLPSFLFAACAKLVANSNTEALEDLIRYLYANVNSNAGLCVI